VERNTRILILSLMTLALLIAGLFIFSYVPDDTFVTLRYARNALRGDGFVFNAGERVEGYMSYLWLLMLVFAGKLGAPLVATARVLSFAFSLGTLALTVFAARAGISTGRAGAPEEPREGWRETLGMFLPAIFLAVSPPFLTWCLSGSEMPLFAFLFLAGCLFLRPGSGPGAAFIVFGLLGLVRPEGILFFLLALAVALVRSPSGRPGIVLKWIGIAAVFYVPYLIWKWSYFRELLPNALLATMGPPGLMMRNGARYLFGFILNYGYLLIVGLLLLRSAGRTRQGLAVPLLLVAALGTEVLMLGGDWMPHYRLFLAAMPFVMLMVSEGVLATARGIGAPVSAVVIIALLAVPGARGRDRFLAERATVHAYALLGQRFGQILPPGTSIGCGSTGGIGYYTDMPIVDILGFTEPRIARHGKIIGTEPGHLKTDGAYILDRKPDLLLFGNVQIHRGEREQGQMHLKVQEREIADLPEFSRDYDFVNIPLGHNFYLSCFKRKDFFLPL
jgi:arabinofuranosyltransferase